MADEEKQALL